MKIARIIVKESTLNEMKRDYPALFTDPRMIIILQYDGKFNRQIALDQLEKRIEDQKNNGKN